MTKSPYAAAKRRHQELLAAQPAALRHPYSEFPLSMKTVIDNDLCYPRAGVRRQPDGQWRVMVWYAPGVVRYDSEPLVFPSPLEAFHEARQEVHKARTAQQPAHQVHLQGVAKWEGV